MAFVTTWADVETIAPELSTVAFETQQAILADVDAQLSEPNIGARRYPIACKLLAAHIATLLKRAEGNSGQVTSESVGSVSRSYATAPLKDPIYDSTKYGIQYRGIIRQTAARAGVVL